MTIESLPPPSAANPSDLLTGKEAAEMLGLAQRTLTNWRWKGNGGPRWVKVGTRLVRYRRGDLEAFVAAGDSGKAA